MILLPTAPSRAEAPTTAIARGRSTAFIASRDRFIDWMPGEGWRIEAQPPDHVKHGATASTGGCAVFIVVNGAVRRIGDRLSRWVPAHQGNDGV